MRLFFLILFGIFLFITLAFGVYFLAIHQSNGSLVSSGVKRKYLLYVPASYDPNSPTPLVISMHGFGDWSAHQMHMSGWNALAEQEGFLVVYPMGRGMPLRWKLYDYEEPQKNPTADILFISDLINHLGTQYNLDTNRIYANGFSNGAGMALALACALSESIAAVGCVAGAYLYPLKECTPNRPVPVIAFHGTADEIVPYHGGPSERFPIPFPSIPDLMLELAQRNGCQSTPLEIYQGETVQGIRYKDCQNGADVALYTITGGGHSWSGGKAMPRIIVGETNWEINATHLMWKFFEAHKLSED